MTDKSILVYVVIFATIGIGSWWIGKRQSMEIDAFDSMAVTTVRRPGLEIVGESSVNLGKFNSGIPIGYHFQLRNVLDRDVMILEANPSCGCMRIPDSLLGTPIAPGALVEVPVIMKTEGRSGELSGMVQIICGHGPVTGTEISETSEVKIHLKCEIQNRIKITPDKIDFGNIVSRESAVIPFSVERPDGGSVSDVNIAVLGDNFRLEGYEIASENGSEIAKGRIVPSDIVFSSKGYYVGTLQVSCGDIGLNETPQTVDVFAVSEPDLTTVPRSIVIFAKRKPTAEISLVGRGAESIVHVQCSENLVNVLDVQHNSSKIHVAYDQKGRKSDMPQPHLSGELTISYQKNLPNSCTNEQCLVRVLIVP
jgi:hypothetical protein